jgi:hypothetical protein
MMLSRSIQLLSGVGWGDLDLQDMLDVLRLFQSTRQM